MEQSAMERSADSVRSQAPSSGGMKRSCVVSGFQSETAECRGIFEGVAGYLPLEWVVLYERKRQGKAFSNSMSSCLTEFITQSFSYIFRISRAPNRLWRMKSVRQVSCRSSRVVIYPVDSCGWQGQVHGGVGPCTGAFG